MDLSKLDTGSWEVVRGMAPDIGKLMAAFVPSH